MTKERQIHTIAIPFLVCRMKMAQQRFPEISTEADICTTFGLSTNNRHVLADILVMSLRVVQDCLNNVKTSLHEGIRRYDVRLTRWAWCRPTRWAWRRGRSSGTPRCRPRRLTKCHRFCHRLVLKFLKCQSHIFRICHKLAIWLFVPEFVIWCRTHHGKCTTQKEIPQKLHCNRCLGNWK